MSISRDYLKLLTKDMAELRKQYDQVNKELCALRDWHEDVLFQIVFEEGLLGDLEWEARAYWKEYDDTSWITLHAKPVSQELTDLFGDEHTIITKDDRLGIHITGGEVWIGSYTGAGNVLKFAEQEGLVIDMTPVKKHLEAREKLLQPLRDAIQAQER